MPEEVLHKTDQPGIYIFACPGCDEEHQIWVEGTTHNVKWNWNGDMIKPTFSPSLRIQGNRSGKDFICHSFIRDGKIEYCSDSTHELAGKVIDLKPF